jgi:hypothetical protein
LVRTPPPPVVYFVNSIDVVDLYFVSHTRVNSLLLLVKGAGGRDGIVLTAFLAMIFYQMVRRDFICVLLLNLSLLICLFNLWLSTGDPPCCSKSSM